MKKDDILKFFNNIKKEISRHSPEILTGIGIAGMISTVTLAVKATPKAMTLIEEAKKNKEKEAHEAGIFSKKDEKYAFELSPIDVIKAGWKPYIATAITGVISIACIIGANSVHARRNAALATAYQLSATAINDYREKVTEIIGQEKEHIIRDKVVEENINIPEVKPKSNVVETFKDVIFYDIAFGQTFYSNTEAIRKAVNDINKNMINYQYASLNDFYDLLNIQRIDIGEILGWNLSRDDFLEVSTDRVSTTKDGRPCYVLEYHKAPQYDYHKEYI